MEKIKKILVPTDFSELSSIGVRHALEIALKEGAELILCNVIALGEDWFVRPQEAGPVRDYLGEHERRLENFLKEKFADFKDLPPIRRIVEMGAPHTNIVLAADRENADLIVMSTHGRTGFNHLLLGSVAEKVVARAHCPVLVVPAGDRRSHLSKAA
jgi:nucleotide-binding universal stress UspA family protein